MRLLGILIYALPLLAESVAGIRWSAPPDWKNEGSSPMRAATYTVPAASGDHEKPECAVYFFGQGQGGSAQMNMDRWKAQFKPAGGKVTKQVVHGLSVTKLDVSGEYFGMIGGKGPTSPRIGYRLLGAVVEGPGGNVFIKFTGPAKTIALNEQKFNALVATFAKE